MHCHTAGSVAPCHRAGRASGLRTSSVFAGTTRCCASRAVGNTLTTTECAPPTVGPSRRDALALLAASPLLLLNAAPAAAIQGTIAGRIPGVSKDMDEDGYFTYTRPEGKSGGHGVGWSEIPRYSFKIPPGWEEVPVSIADLGGTEIDLRFSSKEAGDLFVVVAPVLRFRDVGYNADVRIEELGDPDTIIAGFAPELFGGPIDEETIQKTDVVRSGPLTYYQWQLKPHNLVVATAYRNRVFICTVQANGRQWKKHSDSLLHIQKSFSVPTWA